MKILTKLVIAILVVQIVWFLLPQVEWRWLSEDALVIQSYSGFFAAIGWETWMSWVFLGVTIVITAGLLWFGTKWRILFATYMAASILVLVPLLGINIETGISTALRGVLNVLIGALLAVLFLKGDKAYRDVSQQTHADTE